MDKTVTAIIDTVKRASGVPAVHAPATSAGEKVIWRTSPGQYDGEWETFFITLRFISKDVTAAFDRCTAVSKALCRPGDKAFRTDNGCAELVTRDAGGGSGYIGKTGHFFVLTRYEIRRRLTTIPYESTASAF